MSNGSSATPIAERAWRPGVAPELDDEIAEAVDHGGGGVEPRRAVDEAERLDPALHSSRSPSDRLSDANIESAVARAAS